MKILVTNDDGIDADGISLLAKVASEFGEVTFVAPKNHQSGCSHQMTFEGHLDAGQREDGRWWVDGFPADCVRIGLSRLCPDADVVLSGVNHGSNLGLDNFLSGDRRGSSRSYFFGLPAIAMSQFHKGIDDSVWVAAEPLVRRTLQRLLADKLQNGHYWNVNFPVVGDTPSESIEFIEQPLCLSPLPSEYLPVENGFEYVGDYHARDNIEGTDVAACHAGKISMTLVRTGNLERICHGDQAANQG